MTIRESPWRPDAATGARPRAAVVQIGPVHDEVVPSVIHALEANGLEATAFLDERLLGRGDVVAAFTPYGDRVRYRPVDSDEDLTRLAAEVAELDLLVLNTFQRDRHAQWTDEVGLPTLGIVHNAPLLLQQSECLEAVRSGGVGLLTLAPHVTSFLMSQDPYLFSGTATIAAWMWDAGAEPLAGTRRLTIPGAVDRRNRDLSTVLEVVPDLVRRFGRDAFEVAIVGGGRDRGAFEAQVAEAGLSDVFWFAPRDGDGFVASEVYYRELARSTFLLPLLPDAQRNYRLHKISAAVSSSIGFVVPAVVDRWTATVYDLPAVSYPAGRLADGLARAVEMRMDEVAAVRDSLADRRERVVGRSADELGTALMLLGRAPATAPRAQAQQSGSRRADRASFIEFAERVLPHSHAQRLQDLWALWESGFAREGYFVEFGALNGKDFSNSYLLEQLGWDGVVAEPNPGYEDRLRANRTCTVSTKCVMDESGSTVTFHAVRGRPALSTVAGYGTDDARSHLREEFVEHEVVTITLEDLLREAGAPEVIDYLSIDTEGSELTILNAYDFEARPIRLISVEHNETHREALKSLLESKGYRRRWPELSGHDDWYVHESAEAGWNEESRAPVERLVAAVEPFNRLYHERHALVRQFVDRAVLQAHRVGPPAD